jgi:hypothetical protein
MKYIVPLIFMLTFFSCSKDGESTNNAAASTTGKGGSLARFTITGNYLYLVDDMTLKTFKITDPQNTSLVNTTQLRFGVETIYSYKDKLFIGSTDGMYIYSITNPENPTQLSEARHVRSCDPVVANDSVSFITLRGNTRCGPATDGLYVYDIRNILAPVQINLTEMPTPNGLGLQDSILYVCQKSNGLSVYNVSKPATPLLRKTVTGRTFEDVITYGDLLICYVSTGLALYDISAPSNPVEITLVSN